MMKFAFLEYAYNPANTSTDDMVKYLTNLGFQCRRSHFTGRASIWVQGYCVLLLRNDLPVEKPGITGIGMLAGTAADQVGTEDFMTNMRIVLDPNGFRTLICVADDTFTEFMSDNYGEIETIISPGAGLMKFTSIIYGGCTPELEQFYLDNGWAEKKHGSQYLILSDVTNKFSILFDRNGSSNAITAMIAETDDVFGTTRILAANSVRMRNYKNDPKTLDFGELTHKIVGYSCIAHGNENKFSIEKCADEALPNTQLIFRMRKRMLTLDENILSQHVKHQRPETLTEL